MSKKFAILIIALLFAMFGWVLWKAASWWSIPADLFLFVWLTFAAHCRKVDEMEAV